MIDLDDVEHFLGKTGFMETAPGQKLMPAEKVRIAWNHENDGCVTEVFLTDDMNEWLRHSDRYQSSGGDCYADWMKPTKQRMGNDIIPDQTFDPAGTFGTMLALGFVNKGALRQALRQFARIEECSWARRFLFSMDGELSPKDLKKPA